jgi:hypothetical protein
VARDVPQGTCGTSAIWYSAPAFCLKNIGASSRTAVLQSRQRSRRSGADLELITRWCDQKCRHRVSSVQAPGEWQGRMNYFGADRLEWTFIPVTVLVQLLASTLFASSALLPPRPREIDFTAGDRCSCFNHEGRLTPECVLQLE